MRFPAEQKVDRPSLRWERVDRSADATPPLWAKMPMCPGVVGMVVTVAFRLMVGSWLAMPAEAGPTMRSPRRRAWRRSWFWRCSPSGPDSAYPVPMMQAALMPAAAQSSRTVRMVGGGTAMMARSAGWGMSRAVR